MDSATFMRHIAWTVTLTLGMMLFGSLISTAQAVTPITPNCGDTIGPGGDFILGGDLGPCATDPALIVNSAKLDLGGYTVSCDGTGNNTGIKLDGKKSTVSNGTVSAGCGNGVFLMGEGKHTVKNVTSENHSAEGFNVVSDSNLLMSNTATNNDFNGFNVYANGNELISNTAKDNASAGFRVGGDKNDLAGNLASGNFVGFQIDKDGGFSTGSSNTLSANIASGNTEDGFFINADGNKLTGNASSGNGGDGFEITTAGNKNKLQENLVWANDVDGIRIASGGSDNSVQKNTAIGNADVDLNDEDVCDNTWKKNLFVTDNELDGPGVGCVQ